MRRKMKSSPSFLGHLLKGDTKTDVHEVELEELDLKRRYDNTMIPLMLMGWGRSNDPSDLALRDGYGH